MKKQTIALALAAIMASGSAMAWQGGNDGNHCGSRGYHKGMSDHHGKAMMEREYTADEIRTLMEARLLQRGNDNVEVGKVTATDEGYTVTIVTKNKKDLVRELELGKNGIPLKKLKMWEERQARKQADGKPLAASYLYQMIPPTVAEKLQS
ncbi:hypothetical protein [Kistimonas asteriae]|uniref:hypothetical protein n=1 Tax=Kistimonas asteriae TaxID=517724 RepID=UPI001BA91B70|nr:hypothetical protein [Kistimonas asteriae]